MKEIKTPEQSLEVPQGKPLAQSNELQYKKEQYAHYLDEMRLPARTEKEIDKLLNSVQFNDSSQQTNFKQREIKGIPENEYNIIREESVKNKECDKVMLGKWESPESENCYTNREGEDHTYFDLNGYWDDIKDRYNITDDDMFEAFNKPFLDEQIEKGKDIYFSHDPDGYGECALKGELRYIEKNGYVFDPESMKAVQIWRE